MQKIEALTFLKPLSLPIKLIQGNVKTVYYFNHSNAAAK